jgi:hypothetical protein
MIALAALLIIAPVLVLAAMAFHRPQPVRLNPDWFQSSEPPSVKRKTPCPPISSPSP